LPSVVPLALGQAGCDGRHGHHLGPHALDSALDDRRLQVGACEGAAFLGAPGVPRRQGMVEVDQHHYACFGGDTADPYRSYSSPMKHLIQSHKLITRSRAGWHRILCA
jgi:hypothetical protein